MSTEKTTKEPLGLEDLTRERARPGFEERVIRRIASRRRKRFAGAACAAIVVAALGWWIPNRVIHRAEREARLAEARAIEAEAAALERELASLRALKSSTSRVYLGGSETFDLVVDLDRLARASSGPANDRDFRPARFSP